MKCPHCEESVSVFAREINRFGRNAKTCPYCHEPVRLSVSFARIALLLIPVVLLVLFLKQVLVGFGMDGPLASALASGPVYFGMLMLSFRLKPHKKPTGATAG